MQITQTHLTILVLLIILIVLIRYGFEKTISRLFKYLSIEESGTQVLIKSLILILFNLAVLALFTLLKGQLFAFSEIRTGIIILSIGLVIALLVALLSILAIKAGFGKGYDSLVQTSKLSKVLTWITFLFLVGPSEDLFFIGFVQNTLTPNLGWGAIIAYLLIFLAYHYANVLSGIETKQEFFGTLPVRLMVSILLSLSFYFTNSLLYGFIVHNLVDTLSYAALSYTVNQKQKQSEIIQG